MAVGVPAPDSRVDRDTELTHALASVRSRLAAAALLVGSMINRHDRLPGGFSEAGPSEIGYIQTAAALRDGRVLVLGDNRRNSRDSRAYGGVPVSLIEGRVVAVL